VRIALHPWVDRNDYADGPLSSAKSETVSEFRDRSLYGQHDTARTMTTMAATQFDAPMWESLTWLESQTVGRLCVVDLDYPLAFPINYRTIRDGEAYRIVFRTVPHSAVGRYIGPASLEVDQIDSSRRNAWSVIARGELRDVVDHDDLPDSEPLLSEGRDRWKVLDVVTISGRRFESTTAADRFTVDWQPAAR
jgi:hypothetical protein